MRVGYSYDSHRFDADRPLVLGGVTIPDHPGLTGHSDADAVVHAVIDALLGAAGAGDIGTHFPSTDERWRNADSMDLLRRTRSLIEGRNYQVVNVDVTVVCESPRIGPHVEAMRKRLGEVLGVGAASISVKGKTNEGMGWIGARQGLLALAAVLVDTVREPSRLSGDGGGGLPL